MEKSVFTVQKQSWKLKIFGIFMFTYLVCFETEFLSVAELPLN